MQEVQMVVGQEPTSLSALEKANSDKDVEVLYLNVAEETPSNLLCADEESPTHMGHPTDSQVEPLRAQVLSCCAKACPKELPHKDSTQDQQLTEHPQTEEVCEPKSSWHTSPRDALTEEPEMQQVKLRLHEVSRRCPCGKGSCENGANLKNSFKSPHGFHMRTLLVGPGEVLHRNPTGGRLRTQPDISNLHHPFQQLRSYSDPFFAGYQRLFTQSLLHMLETSMPTDHISNLSLFHQISPGWASKGFPGLHQNNLDAAFSTVDTSQETRGLDEGERTERVSSRPSKANKAQVEANELLISALAEQIVHQQRDLQIQEGRIYLQERRIRQLEKLFDSMHLQQEWEQEQQQDEHPWKPPQRRTANPSSSDFERITHLTPNTAVNLRASATPDCQGCRTPVSPLPRRDGAGNVTAASGKLENISRYLEETGSEQDASNRRSAHRKKLPFCCS